ncbi:MAG: DUF488 domain-containing protein [Puniceicoccales bacterium]|jgi:uncharacterized protein YeaO (DUF488 family)|nr:DUF488 domain-containing protein [Puniceicoccales bacterium]
MSVVIYTSYFAFIPKLPADMFKVSISLFTPKWAKIDRLMPCLNPTEQLLKEAKSGTVSVEKSLKTYREEILSKLSPIEVYNDLVEMTNKANKKDLALLCYEKPGDPCHRRIVAEWLEEGSNISVLEFTPEGKQLSFN